MSIDYKKSYITRAGCLPYNPTLKNRARELRNNMTKAEKKLWYDYLRNHSLQFHRQKIIGSYIVDFYCSKARLIIEVDGDIHSTKYAAELDRDRNFVLEDFGLTILRFPNNDVLDNIELVIRTIEDYLKSVM